MKNECQSPIELFESLFSDEIFDHACREIYEYASKKLRSFIAVLILSEYIDLPRRYMYWKLAEDSHSSIVTLYVQETNSMKV